LNRFHLSRLILVMLSLLLGDAAARAQQPAFAEVLQKAEAGNLPAQCQVGVYYLNGTGTPVDYVQAAAWLHKAAARHNAPAMSALGWMYALGLGVPKDEVQAFGWYLQGATGGDRNGQRLAADGYRTGTGVARDDVQSAAWYKKAAVQGDLLSQVRLAVDYLNGTGVEKNVQKAFTYFLNAAYQGSGWAQFNVARCYWLGLFVPRDPIQAYKWATLAGQSYHDATEEDLMKTLNSQLSASQIAAGENALKLWSKEKSRDLQDDSLAMIFRKGTSATFSFELLRDHILIHVSIEGHGIFYFVVDTGAHATVVDEKLAASIGIKGTGNFIPIAGLGQELALSPLVSGIDLELPGLSLPATTVSLIPLSFMSPTMGHRIDGIIGFDLLKHFTISIDFTHTTIEFSDPQSFQADPSRPFIPLEVAPSGVYVETIVSNHSANSSPAKFLIDTGSGDPFMLSPRFVQANPSLKLFGFLESDAIGFGGTSRERVTQCTQIQIGDIPIQNPAIQLAQENQGAWVYGLPGLIGIETLRRFDLVFDFSNKKLYLNKNDHFEDPYDHPSIGLDVIATGPDLKTLKIIGVAPDSPAAKAGFQTGDILFQIDNLIVRDWPMDMAQKALGARGLHHIIVNRNGQQVRLDFQMKGPSRSWIHW
jgi:hypothetical protein